MTKVLKSKDGDFIEQLDIDQDRLTMSEYLSDAKDYDSDDDLSAEIAYLESKNVYAYELLVNADGRVVG